MTKKGIWAIIIGSVVVTIGGFAVYFKNKNTPLGKPDENNDEASTSANTSPSGNTGVAGGLNWNASPTKTTTDNIPPPPPPNAPLFKLNEVLYSSGTNGAAVFSQPDTSSKYLLGSIPKYNPIGIYKGISNTNKKMALVQVVSTYKAMAGLRYITFSQLSNVKP